MRRDNEAGAMKDADLLLGLDIGTQGAKGDLVDRNGQVVAQAQVEHGCSYPRPGWVEQDMLANWWQSPARVVRDLLAQRGITPDRIAGVAVSGLYPAMGPTDSEGNPLAGAILYSDNRALEEVDEVNLTCGLRLTSEELTPKLLWFLRHQPDLASRMRMFFDAAHYAVYRLTGAYVQDTMTLGLWGAIYSAPHKAWRPEVCRELGIPVDLLPTIQAPAEIAGRVHARAAADTGLLVGTPVLPGMPDLVASILSAGATRRDEAIAYYGTAGVVPVLLDDLLRACWEPFPQEDGYLFYYAAYSLAVGDAVKWFRDVLGEPEVRAAQAGGDNAYQRLDSAASGVPAGADGLILLPYFQGQRSPEFDPHATGVFFGMTPVHTRAHYFRAVLESWGYSIRDGLTTSYPQSSPIRRLVATGGGARSSIWRQIVSDITGLPQTYVPEADGPLGAAYVAGLGLGWFTDFEVLRSEWVRNAGVTQPTVSSAQVYDRMYPLYRALHRDLRPTFTQRSTVMQGAGTAKE
jgi:xylulokinase